MRSVEAMDPGYHVKIFSRYGSVPGRDIDFSKKIMTESIMINATEQHAGSKIGLLINPGMTVPRESFYPVFSYFPDINILVYDKRGHGDSGGSIDNKRSVDDDLYIAKQWKDRIFFRAWEDSI